MSGSAPLTAVQLLWVNMIMDTLGALALATEPPNNELMKRPPVPRGASFITKTMWRNIIGQSIYQLAVLAVLNFAGKKLIGLTGSDGTKVLNTLIFNAFVFCQVYLSKLKSASYAISYLKYHNIFAFHVFSKSSSFIYNEFWDKETISDEFDVWSQCFSLFRQVFNEINSRDIDKINIFRGMFGSWIFLGVMFCTVTFQVVIIEFLGTLASTVPLNWQLWLLSIVIGFVSMPIAVVLKCIPVETKTKQHDGYDKLPSGPQLA